MPARVINAQSYRIGINQFGTFPDGKRPTRGRSIIVDPWGVATTMTPDEQSIVQGTISAQQVQDLRARFAPSQDMRVISAA